MPFLVFLSYTFATIEKMNKTCVRKLPKCQFKTKLGELLCFIPTLIYCIIVVSVLVSIAYAGGAIMLPIMLFPAYYYNCKMFCMIMRNWSGKRRYEERSEEEAKADLESNQKVLDEKYKKQIE